MYVLLRVDNTCKDTLFAAVDSGRIGVMSRDGGPACHTVRFLFEKDTLLRETERE